MTEQPHAIVERDGHVLVVTMNRPEVKNAISVQMSEILSEAWDEVNRNPDIRVCILTGAGGNFSAGADLKYMTTSPYGDEIDSRSAETGAGGGAFDPEQVKPLLKGFQLTKPLITAVEGYAIAGGSELLLASDIRVAGESARFGLAEVRWGLFPMAGSSVRLPRQVPYTFAADMLLTGRQVTTEEALQMGLIGHVVADGEALAKARELADTIAANGPIAVRNVLQSMRATESLPEAEAFKIETRLGVETFRSEDAKEGPQAFIEKRRPVFRGK